MYDQRHHFDNYVGSTLKLLRSFFNYLNNEKGMNVGNFHRKFYTPHEDIEIVVVNPERLNFLIYSKDLSRKLDELLLSVKDIFVFGCAVGLRYSDLMALKKTNLETINKRVYLKVISQKTQTFSHVKLPPFAIDIIKKYNTSTNDFILPSISTSRFNDQLKLLMAKAGFTELITKTRNRRGIPVTINHSTKSKMQFRFCDLVTSHTMRRSAITTMLSLGMNEQVVRQISGHAANSKEFYRYVSFAQNYIDTEIDLMHKKLKQRKLVN
jgi:integrase